MEAELAAVDQMVAVVNDQSMSSVTLSQQKEQRREWAVVHRLSLADYKLRLVDLAAHVPTLDEGCIGLAAQLASHLQKD